jgi:hypothetical protein
MNKIEKFIYDKLKSKPWIKYLVRNVYQTIFDILPKRQEFSINTIDYRENYFFGFHDKTPFANDCKKVLANHLTIKSLKMPGKNDGLVVGYFDFSNGNLGSFIKIKDTYAWNYHKGCRLQWVDDENLIFNSTNKGKLTSTIVNISTLQEKIINYPIDTVSSDGDWATSFSYQRLQKLMPGYGYRYEDEGYLNENAPRNSGLFLINLKENSRSLILSLNELIADIIDIPGVLESQHYVTHSEFSYDGKYISFLHRWTTKDIRVRQTRLVIYDLNNKTHIALPTEGMVSHYVWNQDNQIIAYCNVQQEDCHVLFNVPNVSDFKKIVPEKLNSDGHQSFITNTEFVTDTYPDKYRMAKLYKVQIENDEVQLLASLHSPKKFQTRDFQKHISCDLHPRVSPGGKYVSFDSIRYNYRSLCVMKLPN